MSTSENKKPVEEVIFRMKRTIGASNDNELGEYLLTSGKNVSNWRSRGGVPDVYLLRFANKTGVKLEWLTDLNSSIEDYEPLGRVAMYDRARYGSAPKNEFSHKDFLWIPHYDVKASAGLGAENGHEEITHRNAFRRDWWQRHVGVPSEYCFSLDVVGDSMAPRLTEAHVPIVQRIEDNEMLAEAIYVFRLDGEVFIKHLERVPGRGLIARSENPNYTPWEIGDGKQYGEFKIIGRVIRKQLIDLP